MVDMQIARVWLREGDEARNAGQLDEARQHYQRLLEEFQSNLEDGGDEPQALRGLSTCLGRLADLDCQRGRSGQALELYAESYRFAQRFNALVGETPVALRLLGSSLKDLAKLDSQQGRNAQALERYEQMCGMFRQIHALVGDKPEALRDLSFSLVLLADFHEAKGRSVEAREGFEESCRIARRLYDLAGENPSALRCLGTSLLRLADLDRQIGTSTQARERYEELCRIYQRVRAGVGDEPEALRDLGMGLQRLADLDRDEGRPAQALERYEQVLQLVEEVRAVTGDTAQVLRDLIVILARLAEAESARGQYDRSNNRLRRRLEVAWKIFGVTSDSTESLADVSKCLKDLGDSERSLGQFDSAHVRYSEALEIAQRIIANFGETPDTLTDLCCCLQRLGLVEEERGQIHLALERFKTAHEISERVVSLTGDTPRALGNVCIGLGNLGDAASTRGDFSGAHDYHSQALNMAQRIIALGGETPEALVSLSSCQRRVGKVHQQLGRLDAAYERYWGTVEVAKKILELDGETPRALDNASLTLSRLADVEASRGQLEKAFEHEAEALEIHHRILELAGRTPRSLWNFAACLIKLGEIESACGRSAAAYERYGKSLDAIVEVQSLCGDTPQTMHGLSACLRSMGEIDGHDDHGELAYERFSRALELDRKAVALVGETPETLGSLGSSLLLLGEEDERRGMLELAYDRYCETLRNAKRVLAQTGETPDSLLDLGVSLLRLGDMELRRNELDSAYERYARKLDISRQVLALTGETSEALHGLAVSLNRLGKLERGRGNVSVSVSYLLEQVSCTLRMPVLHGRWPGAAACDAVGLCAMAGEGCLPLTEAFGLRVHLAQRLSEHLDLNSQEALKRVFVALFHSRWLGLALQYAPERIPEVLAAMQGRKVAALVLDELEFMTDVRGEARSAQRQRFLALRTELRRLALGLQVISGGAGRSYDAPPGSVRAMDDRERGRSVSLEAQRALLAEFEAKRQDYQQARLELSRDPDFAVLAPQLQIDSASIQAWLPEGHAMVLLVHTAAANEAEGIALDKPDDRALPPVHALLLRRESIELLAMPELASLPAQLRAGAVAGGQRAGLRCSAGRATSSESRAPTTEPDLSNPAQALWAPLAPRLGNLHTLHVVTHGELHIVPAALDAPAGLVVRQYPGLVYFWQQHLAPQRAPPHGGQALALQVHSPAPGEDPPPIPFVHAEAQLTQALWHPVLSPLPMREELAVTVVHLAGHGLEGQGQDACLLLGSGQRLGLHELLSSRIRAPIVYLSACLVGRTSDDLDGDPLGMVSGFLLRGARCVVAPLVPISDLYSPLLAVLFHWELKGQRGDGNQLDASRALQHAKARLSSGDWPEEIVQRVRVAYVKPFEALLKETLRGGDLGRIQDELLRQFFDWLPPRCSVVGLRMVRENITTTLVDLGSEAAARWGAERLANMLVDARAGLHLHHGVRDLVRYMQVYGAPQWKAGEAAATPVF